MYQLKYLSGGGIEYLDGDWEYTETKTFHIYIRKRRGVSSSSHVDDVIKLRKDKHDKEEYWYPNRAGIPHWFELKQMMGWK